MTILYFTRGGRGDTAHLLPCAARQFCGAVHQPCPDLTIARESGGKPYFPAAPWLYCSVSHSGDIWICACSTAPVGVDIQRIQPTREGPLARRFFHPDEIAWLDAHQDGFFSVWTAKEACVKLTGQGIDSDFSRFSVITEGSFCSPFAGTVLRHLPFKEGYVLCLCGAEEEISFCTIENELTGST